MAIARNRVEEITLDTDRAETESASERQTLPMTLPTQMRWLDEQQGFIEVEREYSIYKSDADFVDGWTTSQPPTRRITDEVERDYTALMHVHPEYEKTGRKSYSSQRDVVDAWEAMQFPTHNIVEYEGRKAAELYTLSSYQSSVQGPSEMVPIMTMGGMVENPAVRVECELCDWTSRTEPEASQAISGIGYRSTSLQEHFSEEHSDKELHNVTSSEFGNATVPVDDSLYTINRGHSVTESEKNFRALQFPDGSGLTEHYDTIESLRTRSGVVLKNSQCFSKGNAHCSFAKDYEMQVPLSGMRALLEDDETLFDITDVVVDAVNIRISGAYDRETGEWDYSDADVRSTGVDTERGRVAVLDNGHAIGVVYDETANNYHERIVGFRLEPDEVDALRSADDVYDLLKPNIVTAYEQDGYDIVGANQMSSGPNFYDEDLLGDSIIRQGEWYFLPMDEDFSPDTPVYHTYQRNGWDLENVNNVTTVDSIPGQCARCNAQQFIVEQTRTICKRCGHAHIEMDGSLEEDEQPFDKTVLGNHRPREVTVDEDGDIYVRGSVRHVNNEHSMINFRDRWHRAVENTKDGVVFDKSTPDSTSGRSSETAGVARVE